MRTIVILVGLLALSPLLSGATRAADTGVSAANKVKSSVPFVGCDSDGQVGPQKPPTIEGLLVQVDLPREASGNLEYYGSKIMQGGVLAPKSWYCYVTSGSNGDSLFVFPEPISPSDFLSGTWKGFNGAAIQLTKLFGGTSGRFGIAKVIARAFPLHKQFALDVMNEGIVPREHFNFVKFSDDIVENIGANVVEYETPAFKDGLGTISRLVPGGSPIDGILIIQPGDTDLISAAIRLPPEIAGLAPIIIEHVAKENAPSSIQAASSIFRRSPLVASAPPQPLQPDTRFATSPLVLNFPKPEFRPDDIAVIIGNGDYSKLARDIPDARTAYADAESMRQYAINGLGVRDGNIIFLKDATGNQMVEVFGNDRDHRGRIFNWIKPGVSRVFVYYIGHGAPGNSDGRAMLVPVDASAGQIALSGFPLDLLYTNLGKAPAAHITLVLEACFSGMSPAGSVMGKALPLAIMPKAPRVPPNMTVISAAASDQMANWEQDDSHAMFTRYFLKGMSGEADKPPYGNGDGVVSYEELDRYLKETLSYMARRTYGRDQTAQIIQGEVN
jgi:Caspase domain